MWELPIFPEGSLKESVVTTVWVGVWIISLFNLRLGWTYSGLVVPGYLVPLMIARPWGAAVVLVEGILTYGIVWFLSERCSRFGWWSALFGRDRFFALVLCSTVVRVGLDGYLLPRIGDYVTNDLGIEFDAVNRLHSFGLIVVSLIANQLWKPGLRRGIGPLAFTLALTYVVVRFVLMRVTNFGVASLEYMYEDISASILASPKAYIVLITAAYLASWMNLLYAWDFNGILIPSLLALQWYDPIKILTSFTEAWVILFAAILVLKLPALREANIEGARKLLLFFNLSFLYKLTLGHLANGLDLAVQPTDLFGFGYLLPTLMAVKMHDKGIAARLSRTTLQVSIMAAALSGCVGFALTFIPTYSSSREVHAWSDLDESEKSTLVERLRDDKIVIYRQRSAETRSRPGPPPASELTIAVDLLRSALQSEDDSALARTREQFHRIGFETRRVEDRYLYVRERGAGQGWGIFVIDLFATNELTIQVPRPLVEGWTLEAGAFLFRALGARVLLVSTAIGRGETLHPNDVMRARSSSFRVFQSVLGRGNVLQVRGSRSAELNDPDATAVSSLWVKKRIPRDLKLRELDGHLDHLDVVWSGYAGDNIVRRDAAAGFAELFVSRLDQKRLLARFRLGLEGFETTDRYQRIDGFLREQILERKGSIAGAGSELYQLPPDEALLFFDEEVVAPLVQVVESTRHAADGSDPVDAAPSNHADQDDLRAVHASAAALGYGVARYRDRDSGREYVVLDEAKSAASERKYWGTYVFRLGPSRPFIIEIPHPLAERNTFEYGVALFEKLEARMLLVAGAHPHANADGSSNVNSPRFPKSLYNLVHQVALRELAAESLLVVQVRAFGFRLDGPSPQADALLAFADGTANESQVSPLGNELLSVLYNDRTHVEFVAGEPSTEGYELRASAQARYLSSTQWKEFVGLWLSPFVRLSYRQVADGNSQSAHCFALGIETREELLHDLLRVEDIHEQPDALPDRLVNLLRLYQSTQDINALRAIQQLWPHYRIRRIVDRNSRRAFLLVEDRGKLLPIVTNLAYSPTGQFFSRAAIPIEANRVRQFVDSNAVFLFLGESHED